MFSSSSSPPLLNSLFDVPYLEQTADSYKSKVLRNQIKKLIERIFKSKVLGLLPNIEIPVKKKNRIFLWGRFGNAEHDHNHLNSKSFRQGTVKQNSPFGGWRNLVYPRHLVNFRAYWCGVIGILGLGLAACSPRVIEMSPTEGPPGTVVSLSTEYLVGWPRVEVGGQTMDYYQLKLLGARPERAHVPAEELVWIEDKVLQFRIPDLPPGNYTVTIHDDKGPPGERIYSFLETTAYLLFPPVWPFVLRSNQTEIGLRILSP